MKDARQHPFESIDWLSGGPLALRNEDVDLVRGMLTIRQTKFAKSRQRERGLARLENGAWADGRFGFVVRGSHDLKRK